MNVQLSEMHVYVKKQYEYIGDGRCIHNHDYIDGTHVNKQKYRNNTSMCPRIRGTMCVAKGEKKRRPACRERGGKAGQKSYFIVFNSRLLKIKAC